jgi:hypothetical protein
MCAVTLISCLNSRAATDSRRQVPTCSPDVAIGTNPLNHGYQLRFSVGPVMHEDFTWRNFTLFVVVLMITRCLMMWAVIIAVDRLISANLGPGNGAPNVQPNRVERRPD